MFTMTYLEEHKTYTGMEAMSSETRRIAVDEVERLTSFKAQKRLSITTGMKT